MNDLAGLATDVPKEWLLSEGMPWARYRTLLDLLHRPEKDPEVLAARQAMIEHPHVQNLIAELTTWPGYPLKRHNDAKHLIHKLATLADFGLRAGDPGMATILEQVMAHQAPEGAFQMRPWFPKLMAAQTQKPVRGCYVTRQRSSMFCWPWAWATIRGCRALSNT